MIYEEPMDALEDVPGFKPYTTSLNLRLTHSYVDRWRDLDKERNLGTVVVLQRSEQRTDNEDDPDPCEPTCIMLRVKVQLDSKDHSKSLAATEHVKQALKDTFTHWGCGHEHDCCGCWNTRVNEVMQCKLDPDQWVLIQSAIRNY